MSMGADGGGVCLCAGDGGLLSAGPAGPFHGQPGAGRADRMAGAEPVGGRRGRGGQRRRAGR